MSANVKCVPVKYVVNFLYADYIYIYTCLKNETQLQTILITQTNKKKAAFVK